MTDLAARIEQAAEAVRANPTAETVRGLREALAEQEIPPWAVRRDYPAPKTPPRPPPTSGAPGMRPMQYQRTDARGKSVA